MITRGGIRCFELVFLAGFECEIWLFAVYVVRYYDNRTIPFRFGVSDVQKMYRLNRLDMREYCDRQRRRSKIEVRISPLGNGVTQEVHCNLSAEDMSSATGSDTGIFDRVILNSRENGFGFTISQQEKMHVRIVTRTACNIIQDHVHVHVVIMDLLRSHLPTFCLWPSLSIGRQEVWTHACRCQVRRQHRRHRDRYVFGTRHRCAGILYSEGPRISRRDPSLGTPPLPQSAMQWFRWPLRFDRLRHRPKKRTRPR